MRVVLATVGTRGDVQPMLALAQALTRRGHHAIVACPDSFAPWVRSLGIEHRALGEDLQALMAEKGASFERSLAGMKAYFREQLLQIGNMGGLSGLVDKLPGIGKIPDDVKSKINDKDLKRQIAIIGSMTMKERHKPDIINGSLKRRIAAGAGVQVQEVNRLLKQFMQMEKMMKQLKKGGLKKLMRQFSGRLPGMGM